MRILPDTHFLNSVRADRGSRGSYTELLSEAIDNSIDADAKEISLQLQKEMIVLEDNGIGITKDRQSSIVTLGEHGAMPTTMLGRFGIGLKYHAVSAGDLLEVDSTSLDGRMKLVADWERVIKSGNWEIRDPAWVPKLPSTRTGTSIFISRLRWQSPTAKDIELARDKLAQIFYPALVGGKKIALNEKPIPILKEPDMTDVVEGDVYLSNGKGAHVRGGIMRTPGRLYYVHVSYKHRVIKPQSTFGCDEYSGLRRMFARVDLTGPWELTRFKDGLADNDEDELEEGVLKILRPVLEKLHSAQMSAVVDEMTALLNEMLPPELAAARPDKKEDEKKKKKKKKPKKIHETNEIKDGELSPTGPTRKRLINNRLLIEFDAPLVDEKGYGHFVPGKPGRIILAKDNEHIARLLGERDKETAVQSLFCIAMMIYMHYLEFQPGKNLELFDSGSFGLKVWNLTKQQNLNQSAVG